MEPILPNFFVHECEGHGGETAEHANEKAHNKNRMLSFLTSIQSRVENTYSHTNAHINTAKAITQILTKTIFYVDIESFWRRLVRMRESDRARFAPKCVVLALCLNRNDFKHGKCH